LGTGSGKSFTKAVITGIRDKFKDVADQFKIEKNYWIGRNNINTRLEI